MVQNPPPCGGLCTTRTREDGGRRPRRLTAGAGLVYHSLRLEMPARASREAGEIPAWTRRCDRGRRPREATVSSLTGRRGPRVIRKPEDLCPSALTTLCVVNGAAAAHAAASKTGGPGPTKCCLLYTSDAADDLLCVDLGGRRI